MNTLKALAPYFFVLACIIFFVPLPVWSANAAGLLALVNTTPDPKIQPEEPEPPPKSFSDAASFDAPFVAWVKEHRDSGEWSLKRETRDNRTFIVDFISDSRQLSRAEVLAQEIITAWMDKNLDPYKLDVTLVVTKTHLRKNGSPTKRDVYVPIEAIAYNPKTDAFEDASIAFGDARKDSPYDWGIAKPQPLQLNSDSSAK